jgi:hypothetical protein
MHTGQEPFQGQTLCPLSSATYCFFTVSTVCCLARVPTQAENVLQLVNARTATAADSALAGLAGGLGQLVSELRGDLLEILAELEARLDFDDDLPPMDVPALVEDITGGLQEDAMCRKTQCAGLNAAYAALM